MNKRVFSIIFTALALMALLFCAGACAEGAEPVAGGACGEGVSYQLDSTGTLTISGAGAMEEFTSFPPWYAHRSSITRVVVEAGVTSIGPEAFSDCDRLTDVTLPDGIASIGPWAFCNCSSLAEISIPRGVGEIADNTFSGCANLTRIDLPAGLTAIGEKAFYECAELSRLSLPRVFRASAIMPLPGAAEFPN